MSTVAHFFIIIVAQKFVITWLTFSLTFTLKYPWYNKENTKTEDTEKGKILHGTFLSDHR